VVWITTVLTNTISIVIVILIKAIIGVIIVMYISHNQAAGAQNKRSIRKDWSMLVVPSLNHSFSVYSNITLYSAV
jgi:hypothetical protein